MTSPKFRITQYTEKYTVEELNAIWANENADPQLRTMVWTRLSLDALKNNDDILLNRIKKLEDQVTTLIHSNL